MEKSIANVFNQMNKRFSTIFFDLDNTLIATRKADQKTCNKVSAFVFLGVIVVAVHFVSAHFKRNFLLSSVESTLTAENINKTSQLFRLCVCCENEFIAWNFRMAFSETDFYYALRICTLIRAKFWLIAENFIQAIDKSLIMWDGYVITIRRIWLGTWILSENLCLLSLSNNNKIVRKNSRRKKKWLKACKHIECSERSIHFSICWHNWPWHCHALNHFAHRLLCLADATQCKSERRIKKTFLNERT